jgi:hypothetical protein
MSIKAADNNTGKEITPMIAVTKKAQIVNGSRVIDIPLVRRLMTVTIKFREPSREEAMKIAIETSQRVIPIPEPGCAIGSALRGGYTVHPAAAGPASTKSESSIMTLDVKNIQ